jgi:hypothetical protein
MKRKLLFTGIFSIALIFMMVLAGCGYDGPSANDIANAVDGKLNDPTVDEIADTVLEQTELRLCAQFIEDLAYCGKLTIVKGIQAWDQADAAYTLTVNTAERTKFDLPHTVYNTVEVLLGWEGAGSGDLKRSDYHINIAEKSNGKSANFNFTFTNMITAKTINGVLTVNTIYDHDIVGINILNEFFMKVLSSFDINDFTSKFTTDKPITKWGQDDVAYTITAETNVDVCFPTIEVPILYDNDSVEWKSALIEWKPLALPTELTSEFNTESDTVHITHYPYGYNYVKNILTLTSEISTARTVTMNFRITRDAQTISGTVTISIKKGDTVIPSEEQDRRELEQLRNVFYEMLRPEYYPESSEDTYRLTCYIDKSITDFGQTDVLYLITVHGNKGDNDGENYYSYLDLPYMSGKITWTNKTTNSAVTLDSSSDPYLTVYNNRSGVAEFNFSYASSVTKTVKGSVRVTVVK